MSDRNYTHTFVPNRQGLCKVLVGGRRHGYSICHLTESAAVHHRNTREREEKRLVKMLGNHQLTKLSANRHVKTHWRDDDIYLLLYKLETEVTELKEALREKFSPLSIWHEAADIANFAAMIADNYERKP